WSGQSCGSTSRLLVHKDIYDDLVKRVVELVKERRLDDPLSEMSQQGTMIDRTQYEKSLKYIELAIGEGATVVTGVDRPEGDRFVHGPVIEPTVLTGVTPDATIGQEEVFGPVLSVIPFDDEAEAVAIANGVTYGLTASVWTKDLQRAIRVARDFEAGFVWVNGSDRKSVV